MKLTRSDGFVWAFFFILFFGGSYFLYDYYTKLGYGSDGVMMPFDEETLSRLRRIVEDSPTKIEIPDRVCYTISEHSKLNDSSQEKTNQLQNAINMCSQEGGGRIVIDRGEWIVGPLQLQSNIHLILEEGSTLVFDEDILSYRSEVPYRFEGIRTKMSQPLLYASECENIKISGKGSIRGNQNAWASYAENEMMWFEILYQESEERKKVDNRKKYTLSDPMVFRPDMIGFSSCSNVNVEGITLERSPRSALRILLSNGISLKDLTIHVESLEGDAVVLDSSSNILYTGGTIQSENGDGIVFQSGLNAEGRAMDEYPLENVRIQDVSITRARNALTVDKAMSGGVNRIVAHNITIGSADYGISALLPPGVGGYMRHFLFENITMDKINTDAIAFDLSSFDIEMILRNKSYKEEDVRLRDMFFLSIKAKSDDKALVFKDFAPKFGKNIRNANLYFRDMTLVSKNAILLQGVNELLFENSLFSSPSLRIMDSQDVFFSSVRCEEKALEEYIDFSGSNSHVVVKNLGEKDAQILRNRVIDEGEVFVGKEKTEENEPGVSEEAIPQD